MCPALSGFSLISVSTSRLNSKDYLEAEHVPINRPGGIYLKYSGNGRYDCKAINCYFFPPLEGQKEAIGRWEETFLIKMKRRADLCIRASAFSTPLLPWKALGGGLERVKMHPLRFFEAGGPGVIMSPSGSSGTLRNRVSGPLKFALCCVTHVHLGGR